MNYSNGYIEELNVGKDFIKSNLEKVLRLLDVLSYISKELDPNQSMLVLKGGTALNLAFTNLARLSVDIDLDYIGSLDKEKTIQDRNLIMSALDNYMRGEGYQVSIKSRESAILASRTYAYTNAFGNRDNIKVEINFIDRIHVLSEISRRINIFDKDVMIQTPSMPELFGMKICALIDRYKPRDLYDVKRIFDNASSMNLNEIRKCAIFYLSLDGIFDISDGIFAGINSIKQEDIKKELLPVLSKNERFDLNKAKQETIKALKNLFLLTDNEKMYLKEFANGNYKPELLFESNEIANRILLHPMAKWRISITNK